MTNNKAYTLSFYNIENLFDVENDPLTNDDDFLPTSEKRWTKKRYKSKLLKLGSVIAKIGEEETKIAPVIVGLAEVENASVLRDLVDSNYLKPENYKFIHFDSLDERGIDVALLYKDDFEVLHSEAFPIILERENGLRDYTRDILLVTGILHTEKIHILVNHWSSKREGENETEFKRIAAAKSANTVIKNLKAENADCKIIVMGDFNDNPDSKSVTLLENESQLFNPFKTVWSFEKGSLNHNFQWNQFDQILFTTNFFDTKNSILSFDSANVFNNKFLTQYQGKFKGQPFRTYVGKKYRGGYSDHFPVYLKLKS